MSHNQAKIYTFKLNFDHKYFALFDNQVNEFVKVPQYLFLKEFVNIMFESNSSLKERSILYNRPRHHFIRDFNNTFYLYLELTH